MNAAQKRQQTRNCIELLSILRDQQFKAIPHVQASAYQAEIERTGEAAKPTSNTKDQITSRPGIEMMLGNPAPQAT
jgi:hypothetical protein